MNLSIVIVSWRSKNDLVRLINSITQYLTTLTYEIIVVDNNSGDDTVSFLKQKFPSITIIDNNFNAGYAKGMNQGIAIAKGEYIVCMNPDMMLTEDCFTPLIVKLRADARIGLIAPQLRYEDNSIQPTIKRDPTVSEQLLILLKLHHIFKTKALVRYLAKDTDYTKPQAAEQLMGAFVLGSREHWKTIGGWDNDYPLWWEDLQLCTDSRKKGFINWYEPSTSLIHYEGKSAAQILSVSKQKRFNKGMRLYFRKNYGLLPYLVVSALHPVSMALAWIMQLLQVKPRSQAKL